MWKCKNCRVSNPDTFKFCLNCGFMKNDWRIIILIIFSLILIPFISSAEQQSLGLVKQGNCIELVQTCATCLNGVNLTAVIYPNKSTQLFNKEMSKYGNSYYNYSFCGTQSLGDYIYLTTGDVEGNLTSGNVNFKVTVTGSELSISQGILYSFFIIVLIFVFILTLYSSIVLPFKNIRDDENKYIISMNDLKYVKIIMIALSYLIFMSILGLSRGISAYFLTDIGIYKVFQWTYWIMFSFVWPIIVCSFIFMIILYLNDKKVRHALERGLPIE